jgi:undecaprenyl-diphosphatase
VWILIAAALAVAWRRPSVVLTVGAAILGAELASTAIKLASGRTRPYVLEPDPPPLVRTHLDLTLPSGHAATSFAAAVVLSVVVARRAPALLLFLLAAGIAWSRVYVGVHYPSDVLLGALLGVAIGLVTVLLAPRLGGRIRALRTPGADPPRSPSARPPG